MELAYRNRWDRTGLDPMDAYREMGTFVGNGLRWLLRGTTHNLYLAALLFLFGVLIFGVTFLNLIVPAYTLQRVNPIMEPGSITSAFFMLLGFFCIVRAVDSLLKIIHARRAGGEPQN